MNRDRVSFGQRVPLLLVLVATVGLAYEALLAFTSVLAPYRFPIPYAVPLFDVPFMLVATGILFVLGVALYLYDFFVLAPRRERAVATWPAAAGAEAPPAGA